MKFEMRLVLIRSFLLIGSIFMVTAACEEVTPDITGCWAHAYEEGENIYQNCDSQDFAVSRFRQVYDFQSDGTVSHLVLHPADAHYMDEAKWEWNESTGLVDIIEMESNDLLFSLKVKKAKKQSLSIERLP